MTLIVSCLIASVLLIVISKIPVAIAMGKMEGGYDNRYPRDQQAALQGFGKRALSAHTNSIEAFPIFAAAVLTALVGQADITMVQNLCIVFICARIAYLVCYWIDQDKLRSTVWMIGLLSCIWMMALAIPG